MAKEVLDDPFEGVVAPSCAPIHIPALLAHLHDDPFENVTIGPSTTNAPDKEVANLEDWLVRGGEIPRIDFFGYFTVWKKLEDDLRVDPD